MSTKIKSKAGLALVAVVLSALVLSPWIGRNAGASASRAGWGAPQPVSHTLGSSYTPAMVVDGQGTAHLLWMDWVDLEVHWPYILYANKPAGGDWSAFTYLPENAQGGGPNAVVAPDDQLHVVWEGQSSIMYAVRSEAGTWSQPLSLPLEGIYADIAVDAAGCLHVVSLNGGAYYTMRGTNGVWTSPTKLLPRDDIGEQAKTGRPVVAVDNAQTVHVVIDHTGTEVEAYHTYKPVGGEWSDPVKLPFNPLVRSPGSLIADSAGALHLLWDDFAAGEIRHVMKEPGGDWGTPAVVNQYSNTFVKMSMITAYLENAGQVHAAWNLFGQLGYAFWDGSGAWSGAARVDMGSGLFNISESLTLAVGNTGERLFAWDSGPTYDPPDGTNRGEIWVVEMEGNVPATEAITSAGGRAKAYDGSVYADFPPGAVSQPVNVQHIPGQPVPARGGYSLLYFGLFASLAVDGSPVASFNLPYTLTAVIEDPGPAVPGTLALYNWDEGDWVLVPGGVYHAQDGLLESNLADTGWFAVLAEAPYQLFLPLIMR